jgi:flagellar biosynthesis component FlhA
MTRVNLLIMMIILSLLGMETFQKKHKNTRKLFKKKHKKDKKKELLEQDNEKEALDVEIDYNDPRSNIEAVHITLGDYFHDRESENIYRVGFLLKKVELRESLGLKIKVPLKKKQPKPEGIYKFLF